MPTRKRDEKGRFSKGARDIEGAVPIYLRVLKSLATDIRGLASRLNIPLCEAIRIACERLLATSAHSDAAPPPLKKQVKFSIKVSDQ